MTITRVTYSDSDDVEFRAVFQPKEFTSLAEALIAFSDQMVTKVGKRIDLTEVEIKHDGSFRPNGFVYKHRAA